MRQRFMDSIPWATLLVGVGVGAALAATPNIAHADHRQSCYAGLVLVFDGKWHPGAWSAAAPSMSPTATTSWVRRSTC